MADVIVGEYTLCCVDERAISNQKRVGDYMRLTAGGVVSCAVSYGVNGNGPKICDRLGLVSILDTLNRLSRILEPPYSGLHVR